MASKNEEDPESFYPKHNVRKINGVKRVQLNSQQGQTNNRKRDPKIMENWKV